MLFEAAETKWRSLTGTGRTMADTWCQPWLNFESSSLSTSGEF